MNFLQKTGSKHIVDEYRLNEALARLYMKCGMNDKAIGCLEQLLTLNSCNKDYYKQILQAKGIEIGKSENDEKIVEVLSKYEQVLPKSNQLKLGRLFPATIAAMSLPTKPPAWVAGPAIPGSGLPSLVCL